MRLVINLAPVDPRLGLAIDEALLESVRAGGRDAARLWVTRPAVIVGRSQAVEDEVDAGFAAERGIPVLRRTSGGGAVYHYPGNLNVSIVLRDGRRIGPVRDAFRLFGATVAAALSGICPRISSEENDLLIDDAKVGGAAQARRGDALLYHTTLLVEPVDVPMDRILRAMRPGYRPTRVASRPRPTISLTEAVGREVLMREASETLGPAISGALGRPLVASADFDPAELGRAQRLAAGKYDDPGWNRSR